MRVLYTSFGLAALMIGALPARAQNQVPTPSPGPNGRERFTVQFRDASMPRKLIVDTPNGNITVRGYAGQDAIIDMGGAAARAERNRRNVPAGMRRITPSNVALDITEENNTIRIRGGNFMSRADLEIQVPVQTSVKVNSNFGGEIRIENINGEIEADTMNGEMNITDVSGPVVASTMNGEINVVLNNQPADKPMSFSTMNGKIDVTLPNTMKANVVLKTNHGEAYTDFDMQLDTSTRPAQITDNRGRGGRFQVRTDASVYGTINGGGPELRFNTFNGNILIRKK